MLQLMFGVFWDRGWEKGRAWKRQKGKKHDNKM